MPDRRPFRVFRPRMQSADSFFFRLRAHVKVVAADLQLEARHAGEVAESHLPRAHVEAPAVPRARDERAFHPAVGKRAALMRTAILDGVEGSVDIEHRYLVPADGISPSRALRNIADARDANHPIQITRKSGLRRLQ